MQEPMAASPFPHLGKRGIKKLSTCRIRPTTGQFGLHRIGNTRRYGRISKETGNSTHVLIDHCDDRIREYTSSHPRKHLSGKCLAHVENASRRADISANNQAVIKRNKNSM